MRKDGIFIAVEVDDAVASDAALAAKLAEVCPVDIFAVAGGRLRSSRRTSTSACCAACAWTPCPRACACSSSMRTAPRSERGRGSRPRGLPHDCGRHYRGERPMNENFSLIVMCLFLLGSLAFLAEQLTSYH